MSKEQDIHEAYWDPRLKKSGTGPKLTPDGLTGCYRMDWVLQEMNWKDYSDGWVLDLGCGNGTLLLPFSKRNWHCVGLDISYSAIDAARERGIEQSRFEVRNLDGGLNIPLTSEKFDVVTVLATLEHLRCPEDVIREASSLMRPGGTIWIATDNIAYYGWIDSIIRGKFPENAATGEHVSFFTHTDVIELLRRCGFSKMKCYPESPHAGVNLKSKVPKRLESTFRERYNEVKCGVPFDLHFKTCRILVSARKT